MSFSVTYNDNKFTISGIDNVFTVSITANKFEITLLSESEFWEYINAILTENDIAFGTESNRAIVLIQE